ncbi:MAG: response regulator [Acidobacteriota bacterium]
MTPSSRAAVIIVDNNGFHRQVLGDFYRDLDFDVRVACDGIEAIEQLQMRRPDLLVLDLIMPRIDGTQLCDWVRSREAFRAIPVIIFSGINCQEIERIEDIDADAYVAKMPMEQIAAALRTATKILLEGRPADGPLLYGFEKMYRREVVLELLQERRTRDQILDSLSEGIVELSHDRRLLKANRAFEQITGQSPGELLSRPLEAIFPEGKTILARLFDQLGATRFPTATFTHGEKHVQIKLQRITPRLASAGTGAKARAGRVISQAPGGEKVQLETKVPAVGYTLQVQDITRRVHAERERQRLRERLAQSEKMSSLGVFVSGAAHELNNPLTSILGFAEVLARKSDDHREELGKIVAGANRCKTILQELMAFAMSLRPEREILDLNGLLREVVQEWDERLQREGIQVVWDLASRAVEARVDASQIGQVVHALLDNAVKALADAGGERCLRIATWATTDAVRIAVADSGPGIPEDLLNRVFDPFFSAGASMEGRGLGLSMAYGIVRAHQGAITVRNLDGGGAEIRIALPAACREDRRPTAFDSGADGLESSRHILVIDDEQVVTELLAEIFSEYQHTTDAATDGCQALRLLGERDYDLILLDLRMPDMSGEQIYDHIAGQYPSMLDKILFMTGDVVRPEARKFLDSVGSSWLVKPFSIDEVIAKAQAILHPQP